MPQEKDKYMGIDIFIKFRCKDAYVGLDISWYGCKNLVMMNIMMIIMEIKTKIMVMKMRMMSLSLKNISYHQGMHLV